MPAAGGFPQHSSGTFWDLPFVFPLSVVLSWVFGLFFLFFVSGAVPGCVLRLVWFDV